MNIKNNNYKMIVYIDKYFADSPVNGVTNYDRFNGLREQSDADILAEKKMQNPVSIGNMAAMTGTGVAIGSVLGGARNVFRKNASIMKGLKRGGMIGGLAAGTYALYKRSQGDDQVSEYNNRLENAQRQAARRERLDWYRNQGNRTNYTY